jgi:hypothetical protein
MNSHKLDLLDDLFSCVTNGLVFLFQGCVRKEQSTSLSLAKAATKKSRTKFFSTATILFNLLLYILISFVQLTIELNNEDNGCSFIAHLLSEVAVICLLGIYLS